jgi:hypothetical protein
MQDFKTKIEGCEYNLKNLFSQQKKKLTTMADAHMAEYEQQLKTKVDSTIEAKLQHLDQMIDHKIVNSDQIVNTKVATLLNEKFQYFENQMATMVDDMMQDVYNSADEGHAATMKHFQQQLEEFIAAIRVHHEEAEQSLRKTGFYSPLHTESRPRLNSVSPTPTKTRFAQEPHETTSRRPMNPADTGSLPDTNRFRAQAMPSQDVRNHPNSTQRIPTTVHTRNLVTSLPPVNHDQALKRAKIHFTGLGDIFVFYNQLLNAMEQFGIYLIPLKNVKYQQSLCPTHHHGVEIDPYRHQVMASTLYQKLQSTEVIPLEYTSIRNIINRFAEVNDGYQVLYAMLELVHPALQTDAVISPPKSNECGDDIHLYAQKFDAWLRYESYANRPYSPREQVNKFINEPSSTFAPAISRVRRLLDAWSPFDITPPEVLKITALPNTIERFMNEELGQASSHVRKINERRNRQHPKAPRPPPINTGGKEGKDEYCFYCGDFGHPTSNCLFMAKLMKANESIDRVDPKTKKELQETTRNFSENARKGG